MLTVVLSASFRPRPHRSSDARDPVRLRAGARGLPRLRAGLPGEGGRALPRPVGEGRSGQPRGVDQGRRAGAALLRRRGGARRRRHQRLPLQHGGQRGDQQGRRQRARLPRAHRHHRPLHQQARDRGAEAALAARSGQRRADLLDRDDRARRRIRPAGHPYQRGRQGRPLRRQRVEDLHQQRHHERRRRGGLPHRPRRRPPGHQPAGGRARHGGLRAWSQPRQDGAQGAGHRRALLRQRRGAEVELARRGGAGVRPT